MSNDRVRSALRKFWGKAEQQRWLNGTAGRRNSDGTYTFVVPGRPTFIYVTVRQANGAQTVVPARNDAKVPHQPNYGVRMRQEYGVYVIESRTVSDLVATPLPESGFNIPSHAASHKHGGSDQIATVTPAANAIPKAESDGKLNAGWLDFDDLEGDIAAMMVEGNNITITYDDVAGTLTFESTASMTSEQVEDIVGAMVSGNTETGISVTYDDATGKLNFVNSITQYTDEMAQDAVGNIMVSGNGILFTYFDLLPGIQAELVALTSDWDIGEDRAIFAENLAARDSEGLSLRDVNGNQLLLLNEGGGVTFRRPNAGTLLDFYGGYSITEGSNTFATGFIRGGSGDHAVVMTIVRAAASEALMGAGVNGDAFRRFLLQADGGMLWGGGTLTRDTNLYRHSANHLKTDDDLIVAGDVSAGVDDALGKLHIYDGTGGCMFVTKSGVAGTAVDIIPAAASNKPVSRVTGIYSLENSDGTSTGGVFSVPLGSQHDITVGGSTWRIGVSSGVNAGRVYVQRTAGTDTATVSVFLIWR